MERFHCPLCKQAVSKHLFEKITGIWKERKAAEQKFKEQEKKFLEQQRQAQKELRKERSILRKNLLEAKSRLAKEKAEIQNKIIKERKKLLAEQKEKIARQISLKVSKYEVQLSRLQRENERAQRTFEQRVNSAVRTAETKIKSALNREIKDKIRDSVNRQVQLATTKAQNELTRSRQTNEAIRKQMSSLQNYSQKQQQRIVNLEKQLKNQTTPQLEGLLYEDKLLEALKKEFPGDKFEHPGKKGDLLHYIIQNKKECGLVVYECKNVLHWQASHVEQTARAKLQRKADYAILVTNAVKKGSGGFFVQKGVIVIHPGGVIALARIIREQIINISQLKLSVAQRGEAVRKTLAYLQGAEFKNALEVVIGKTIEMYEDLKKECKDHVRNWKNRYDSLKTVYFSSTQVQEKTKALISGKPERIKDEIQIAPFPALPYLGK